MTVAVVVVCLALVLAGLVAIVRWGGVAFAVPSPDEPGATPPVGQVLRRYLWWLNIAVAAGFAASVMAAGAGGRLAMRLVAVTADDAAQGQVTEAGEIVGRITVDGTLGFVLFQSFFFGIISGVIYILLRRWLPAGRAGGLAFGLLLLLVAATRIDPLRAANPDFDIVGPGSVAVPVFTAVVLVHGMLVAALAARMSHALPLLAARPGAVAAYAPLVLLLPFFPLAIMAAAGALVALGASRVRPLAGAWRGKAVDLGGRVVLAIVALVSAPAFVTAIADIIGRP